MLAGADQVQAVGAAEAFTRAFSGSFEMIALAHQNAKTPVICGPLETRRNPNAKAGKSFERTA